MISTPNRFAALVVFALVLLSSCSSNSKRRNSQAAGQPAQTIPQGVFEAFMSTDIPPADGFDFAVGDVNGSGNYTDKSSGQQFDGWYVAVQFAEEYSLGIHTGEDWNGSGGGSTDLGQDVHSIANGKVVFAEHCGRLWGNVIMVEHAFYENSERRRIISLYAHLLEIKVTAGDTVRRRQVIGTIGQDPEKLFSPHLHLELRWDEKLPPTFWPSSNGKDQSWVREHYASPTDFIQSHRRLPVPQTEENLVLVDQESYSLQYYKRGEMKAFYGVAFGQGSGQKMIEGDNKTPKGMYFVIQKHRGRFDQPYGEYYGGHWIKINYPNKYDADRGLAQGLISNQQHGEIAAAWQRRQLTLQNTKLGGGIGFHGWIREWESSGPKHLSWGCVVLHLRDVGNFYDQVPEGTMVVIF